jgi:hypothetical protein
MQCNTIDGEALKGHSIDAGASQKKEAGHFSSQGHFLA